jgi:hypothetical protein
MYAEALANPIKYQQNILEERARVSLFLISCHTVLPYVHNTAKKKTKRLGIIYLADMQKMDNDGTLS